MTADQPVGNYWIRAFPDNGPQTFDGGLNSAILRYAGAPTNDPTTKQGPYALPFDEGALHPLFDAGAPGIAEPGKADVTINFVTGLYAHKQFTMNGVAFVAPPLPVLLQILSGARHASQLLPNGSVYELPHNKVVEVTIPATELTRGGAPAGAVSKFLICDIG